MMNISQLRDRLRHVQGKRTLEDFAYDLGIHYSTLGKIYAGKRMPGPKLLDAMGLKRIRTVSVVYVAKGKR